MITDNLAQSKKNILKLFANPPSVIIGDLSEVVATTLKKRQQILDVVERHATPFYLFDSQELKKSIDAFTQAIEGHLPSFEIYYAMKCNSNPLVLKLVINKGLGIDVSSGRELDLALNAGAKKIIFTGPGKTLDELDLAVSHSDRVIINIDSWRELERLANLSKKHSCSITAGIRVFTKYHGRWAKFGIPVDQLPQFFLEAKKYPQINLCGVQVHMSWNESASPYVKAVREISQQLSRLNAVQRQQIQFIDIGGGFLPQSTDGNYPWSQPLGRIVKIANDYYDQPTKFTHKYYITAGLSLEQFGREFAQAVNTYLSPQIKATIFLEPGRIIANNALHIVLTVVDVKNSQLAITDGGINMVGWERYLDNYFPVINLTHPSTTETEFQLCGPLCTPNDVWGQYCYAQQVKENDVIIIPNQGAYTYSLAQEFIKTIPPTYSLSL